MDSLPPTPPAAYAAAPGDIYPRGGREEELCARASRTDWLYLGGLLLLDVGSIWYDTLSSVQTADSAALRFSQPVALGLTWGATLGGGWLAMPKCDPHWVGEAPREGDVHANWPLALGIALVAGATAPIIGGVVVSTQPEQWSTIERSMHVVVTGVAAFGGALLPYLLPPTTWSAAKDLEKLRLGTDGRGGYWAGFSTAF